MPAAATSDPQLKARLSSAILAGWTPHDRRPIYEWARENVILPAAYAITGPFHVEKSPYLRPVFDAILDDQVRIVTIQAGVQTGKSLCGDVAVCHSLVTQPRNTFWNFPTNEAADAYSRRRAMPLFSACPKLAGRINAVERQDRHKVRKSELLFGSHWITIQGANETTLQTYSVPMLVNEELWEWTPGMYLHAKARTSYYEWRKKIVNISQAGEAGCDLDQEFRAGSMEEWEVPCLECRKHQPLHWSIDTGTRDAAGRPVFAGITWATTDATRPGGRWNFSALAQTIRWRCLHCGAEIPDDPKARRAMADFGRFTIQNPNASHENRSFHWPSVACDEVPFATVVEEFLRAKDQEKIGNRIPIREFWLKRMAISYDPSAHLTFELPPTIALAGGQSAKRWELQEYIFLAVDVQRDHFWAIVQAWNSSGIDCVLWAGRLETWTDVAEKQREYDVKDRCVFVDARWRTQEVYRQCTAHGHPETVPGGMEWQCWTAMMGDSRKSFAWMPEPGRRVLLPYSWPPQLADPCLGLASDDPDREALIGKLCPVILFAKGTIDPMSFDRRDMMLRGETSLVAPGPWNQEFAKQMQGEQPDRKISPLGHEKVTSRRVGPNHLLDCYRMALTAACMAKIITPAGGE